MFFKKILKHFKKATASIKEVDLNVEEIGDWFKKNTSNEIETLKEDIKTQLEIITNEINTLSAFLDDFHSRELANQQIPQKAIITVKGNKENYIQKTHRLLKDINCERILSTDIKQVETYIKNANQKLTEYTNSTEKAFIILQEFYKDDMRNIIENIKQIHSAISVIESTINSDKLKVINQTAVEIKDYKQGLDDEKEGAKKLASLETQRNEVETQKQKQENKRKEIITSTHYQDYKGTYEEKEKTHEKQKNLERKVREAFAPIDAALRKYERNAQDSNLIKKYLESPFEALKSDLTLKIIEILEKLKLAIESGEVELKDKKKENALDTIAKLDQAFFDEIKNEDFMINERRKSVEEKIAKNQIMSNLSEIDYHLEHLDNKLKKIDEETERLKKRMADFDKKKETHKLEKALLESTGIIVKIKETEEITETDDSQDETEAEKEKEE